MPNKTLYEFYSPQTFLVNSLLEAIYISFINQHSILQLCNARFLKTIEKIYINFIFFMMFMFIN
jgi:hypothetical protein